MLPGFCSRGELADKGWMYKSVNSYPAARTTRSRSPDGEAQHGRELKRGGAGRGVAVRAGGAEERRPKDWDCPKCGKMAHGWRQRCFFCKAVNPDFKGTYLKPGLYDDKDFLKTIGAMFDGDEKRW